MISPSSLISIIDSLIMWILQGETAVLQLQLYEVRDKLLRDSYETPMGPLTLCHFCLTPIYTYTMVEEILENPQLDFWWFLVRCSSWRRLNLWPWNISSLCCWYSVHFVLCEVWRWCTIENRFIKKSLGSADTWMKKTSLGIKVYMMK